MDDERFEAKQDAVGGWWVKLKDGMSLDHETADTVMVTVTVTDAAGLATSTDVTVTVSDVNEAPSAPEIRGLPRSVDAHVSIIPSGCLACQQTLAFVCISRKRQRVYTP